MNMQRVKRNIERMMRRFPSQQVTLYRPERDAYGQPTDARTRIGTAECWMEAVNRPSRWKISESGAKYDDEGAIWICLLQSDSLPAAQHEDICVMPDGREYAVKNIRNDANIRVFWQLADRRDPA